MQSVRTIRRIALAAASALVAGTLALAPATPAQAATTFGHLKISGVPAKLTVPLADTTVKVTVSFTGPAVTSELYYRPWNTVGGTRTTASVTTLATNGATTLDVPPVTSPADTAIVPGTPLAYTLSLNPYRTPGRYRLTVPIAQYTWNKTTSAYDEVDLSASVTFEVRANPVLTSARSWSVLTGSGAFSTKAKWSWTFDGPDYEKGATIKIYFKAKGKKKYVVVASGRLNASGDAAFTGKKGAIRKTGKAYYVLSAVPFSPRTKSGKYIITKA